MSWSHFIHDMQLRVMFENQPRAFLLHLGGNDIGSMTICRIFNFIRSGCRYIRAAFPQCTLIWIDILPRLEWGPGSPTDRKRRRVNRYGRQLIRGEFNGEVVSCDIDNVTPGFYRVDGVHLSQVGLEMLLDALKDKLMSLN